MSDAKKQWTGLFSDLDPHDIPSGGARVLENCQVKGDGKLVSRGGLKKISFSSGSSTPRAQIVAMYYCVVGSYKTLMALDSAGVVTYARGPT